MKNIHTIKMTSAFILAGTMAMAAPVSADTITSNLVLSNAAPEIEFQDTGVNETDWGICVDNVGSCVTGTEPQDQYFHIGNDNDGGKSASIGFEIEPGAGTLSIPLLHLDASNRVGINTRNPGYSLDVQGNRVRLYRTGTGARSLHMRVDGAASDIEAIGADLFLRSSTSGKDIVINPYGVDGNVGIGTTNPVVDLQIVGDGTGIVEEVLRLASSKPPQMLFRNTAANKNWYFAMTALNEFKISLDGTGKVEAKFEQDGDLKIAGALTQNSDRNNKQAIKVIDSASVLETLANLPISTWEYKGQDGVKHLGPMAQDFYSAFGLGDTPKGISSIDTGGVALAAIKGLNEVVQSKDKEVEALKSELAANKAELAQLKELVLALAAKDQVEMVTAK